MEHPHTAGQDLRRRIEIACRGETSLRITLVGRRVVTLEVATPQGAVRDDDGGTVIDAALNAELRAAIGGICEVPIAD